MNKFTVRFKANGNTHEYTTSQTKGEFQQWLNQFGEQAKYEMVEPKHECDNRKATENATQN